MRRVAGLWFFAGSFALLAVTPATAAPPVPTAGTSKPPVVLADPNRRVQAGSPNGTANAGTTVGRFVVAPNGQTAYDPTTGRTWERALSDTTYEWAAAKSACDGKNVGGQSDWRLPRVEELESLVDHAPDQPLPKDHPFTGNVRADRWSSSAIAIDATSPFLQFTNGAIFSAAKTTKKAVWCVRGGGNQAYPGSASRFTVNGDDVTDTKNGVVWRRNSQSIANWYGSRIECRSKGANYRLPTKEEYNGLFDLTAPEKPKLTPGHPFINMYGVFTDRPFWSITTGSSSASAGAANFTNATIAANTAKTTTATSLCVKMPGSGTWPKSATGRFTVNGDVVLDQESGIQWEKAPTMTGVKWPDADAACKAKSVGGLSGWRLASWNDINTLTDKTVSGGPKLPAGHPFVGIATDRAYWTNEAQSNGSDMLTLNLSQGTQGNMSKMGGQLYAWCARTN